MNCGYFTFDPGEERVRYLRERGRQSKQNIPHLSEGEVLVDPLKFRHFKKDDAFGFFGANLNQLFLPKRRIGEIGDEPQLP